MSGLNIVFAGTPAFGLFCLDALAQSNHTVKAVYSQPDRPSGRGQKMQASAVKTWALEHNIPIYQPINFKDPTSLEELRALEPDVLIVIAYGLILPATVLAIPRLGCINVHASLLPAWRGASPIQQAVLHGNTVSGVTIMQMDVGMDTGDILMQVQCPVTEIDTSESLHDKLAQISAQPLLATLDKLANNTAHAQKQNEALVTYAPKIKKEQANIDWSTSAKQIHQQIRGYNPWPIAYSHVADEVLRIYQASIQESNNKAKPGTVISIDKHGIMVATGDKAIRIEKLQFPGGKAISVADWLNAGRKQIYPGLVLCQ